jgi:hypothetical protein
MASFEDIGPSPPGGVHRGCATTGVGKTSILPSRFCRRQAGPDRLAAFREDQEQQRGRERSDDESPDHPQIDAPQSCQLGPRVRARVVEDAEGRQLASDEPHELARWPRQPS